MTITFLHHCIVTFYGDTQSKLKINVHYNLKGPIGTPKRKESVSWSPFGAIGKAVSSGVNIVGDATKAVGTGVVQGTKAVGSGVVSGSKAVGSGVVSVGSGLFKGINRGVELRLWLKKYILLCYLFKSRDSEQKPSHK